MAAKIDGAVFPGHQGGPHNHAISAMATSLKMAKTNEFIGYQHRIIENVKSMEVALQGKKYENVEIISNQGHCLAIRGLKDMDIVYDIASQVNMEIFYDESMAEFRLSSNAMTTRGLGVNDFNKIIDLFDDITKLSGDVKQKGMDQCKNEIDALKIEIGSFAKQFPLIGMDEWMNEWEIILIFVPVFVHKLMIDISRSYTVDDTNQ